MTDGLTDECRVWSIHTSNKNNKNNNSFPGAKLAHCQVLKEEQHNWTNDPQYLLDHIPVSVTNRTNDVSHPHPQRQNQEQE